MTMKWHSTLLASLAVAAVAIAIGCGEQQHTRVTAPPQGPQLVLNGTGTITDEWNGGPLHGAIFTTLPFGQVVNANVQYTRKIEVYLDGGPRNANAMAAGLNDGLYVFQITDPPGKYLLSRDPARCRVVQVDGGVIVGTVPVNRIPGYASTVGDVWGGSGSTKDNPCHVESSEADGASLAGQHDTNIDTDPGGGVTVQMMPFLDTPNPGGVYKAWMTPLAVYQQKGGDLDLVPSVKGQAAGATPDPGFKNPSRKDVKTDNFKVVEKPPFITITKNLDGQATAGWMAAVYENIDGSWVGTRGWSATPATFPVPFDTKVLACERNTVGTKFDSVLVNGVKTAISTDLVQDEDGNPITCVSVAGISTPTAVAVVFYNHTVKAKAKISIAPKFGVNEVGNVHTFTATAWVDPDETGFVYVPEGTVISFSTNGTGTFNPSTKTCTTVGSTGACTIQLTNGKVGVDVVTASVTINGATASTDGVLPNSDPGTKYWVDATMAIAPDATNGIGESHKFTATFTAIPGTLPSAQATFNSMAITITPPTGFVKGTDYTESTTCASPTVNGMVATCTTTIVSNKVGTFKANAKGTVTIGGTLGGTFYSDALVRETNGQATTPTSGNSNSGPATKIYVAGSLSWTKIDGATPPRYLGGATFEVRRTADRFGNAVTSPTFTVVDNSAPDVDSRDGYFKLVNLPLGKYCITETVPPAGYVFYPPTEQCGIELTVTMPNRTAQPFINSLNGRMTGGSGKVQITPDVYLTSGFTIHCDILLSNNLEINWPGNQWHITKPITSAICIDDPNVTPGQPDAPFDTFIGTAIGELNGVPGSTVQFTFVDAGEPGKIADRATIIVKDASGNIVLSVQNQSISGNLQAHEDQPHK